MQTVGVGVATVRRISALDWSGTRLPVPLHDRVADGKLPMTEGAGTLDVPVDRADGVLWVAGPYEWHSDSAPFDVTVSQQLGCLVLRFSQNRSPWTDSGGAGRPDIDAALRRLASLGWRLDPTD